MKIRVLAATVDVAGRALFRGDEYELADDEAARLIEAGKAERAGTSGASSPPALDSGKEVPAPPADKMRRRKTTKSGGEPV